MDFGGKKLNFIQIGLGTNCTFIHNLAGEKQEYNKNIAWLFEPTSEEDPEKVLGISIEPVADLLDAIKPVASKLPGAALLQAAMGEHDESGAEMQGLSDCRRAELVDQAPPSKRQKLEEDLEYLRNMSCLGYMHPLMPMCKQSIEYNYDIKLDIGCNQKVDVWSWAKLVKNFNFAGTEVLLVDAEGCDTKILRSLLSHCRENPEHWPEMIQFETMGHCDRREGLGAEKAVVEALCQEGYEAIAISDYNCNLIRSSVTNEKRYKKWIYKWFCYMCYGQWRLPYVSNRDGIFCQYCHDNLIEEGRSKPLKLGVALDDLSKSYPVWDIAPEEWWSGGFHHRTYEWKPWEKTAEEIKPWEKTEDAVEAVDCSLPDVSTKDAVEQGEDTIEKGEDASS